MTVTPGAAFAALLSGDARALADALPAADPSWDAALRSLAWLAGLPVGRAFASHEVPLDGDPAGVAAACATGSRGALLAFDVPELARWLALHERTAPDDPRLALGRLELALVSGQGGSKAAAARALADEASRRADAALLVEATAMLSLCHLEAGDLDEATRIARRAVRMARTEELPLPHYYAGFALARARRHAHQYHLAIRIVAALARITPVPWHAWASFELLLAGDRATTVALSCPLVDAVVGAVRAGLVAAAHGDAADFHARFGDAARSARSVHWIARDVDSLHAMIDPDRPADAIDERLRPWLDGHEPLPPAGLLAVGQHPDDPDQGLLAHVVVGPGLATRRALGVGAALGAPAVRTSRPGRIETAASVLALAGSEGISVPAFFEAVYGFAYERELHQGPLEVLVHRVRELLAGTARVERPDGRLELVADRPFTLPDPRCKRSLDDEILGAIARAGSDSARGAARALSLPLRTVQHALRRLVEDGACTMEREGRNISYRIEDTTFSEPTAQHQLGPLV